MMSRDKTRRINAKNTKLSNPTLPSIEGLIKKHIQYLHSGEILEKGFANNKFPLIYKRRRMLK